MKKKNVKPTDGKNVYQKISVIYWKMSFDHFLSWPECVQLSAYTCVYFKLFSNFSCSYSDRSIHSIPIKIHINKNRL